MEVGAVLILAYRRSRTLLRLLENSLCAGINRIYVQIDGPADRESRLETEECLRVVREFDLENPGVLRLRVSTQNLGVASAVLSGCNWAFESEDFLIILEDDCLPAPSFFQFVTDARPYLETSPHIYAISGSQLAPQETVGDDWCLTSYLLIWGWATSREKWQEMYNEILIFDNTLISRADMSRSEFRYWESGAKRAMSGQVDTWDLPLMLMFRVRKRAAIVPSGNLISNVGEDQFASHTKKGSEWLEMKSVEYKKSSNSPRMNPQLNAWLKKNVYKISVRHLLTTRVTATADFLRLKPRLRPHLHERLAEIQD